MTQEPIIHNKCFISTYNISQTNRCKVKIIWIKNVNTYDVQTWKDIWTFKVIRSKVNLPEHTRKSIVVHTTILFHTILFPFLIFLLVDPRHIFFSSESLFPFLWFPGFLLLTRCFVFSTRIDLSSKFLKPDHSIFSYADPFHPMIPSFCGPFLLFSKFTSPLLTQSILDFLVMFLKVAVSTNSILWFVLWGGGVSRRMLPHNMKCCADSLQC